MNIVYEYDASGGTTYYYGLHRVSDGNSQYYLYNAHGDVVQLTDGTGAVTKSYAYDAFGNEINPSASDTNPFRYCGEYYDIETGTIYLRARYYDPVVGRFLSEDTHWNINNRIYGDDPLKLNKYTVIPSVNALLQSSNLYVYCINNPNYYVDITGDFIISVSTLLIAGGALVFGTIGGFVGNKVAENNGAEGWDKAGYIAGGALIGAVGGGALGAVAAPAVVGATGVAGISVSSAGITGIVAGGTTLSPALLDLYNHSVSHIFSNDHIKKGIMQLGTDKIDIFNKIINITNKHSDKWVVGSNEIRTVINNIEVTIRFNVVDNVIRSINAFVGYSERVIGNLINLNK